MSFGQASGPPASAKQVQQLLALLEAAGHSDFRDARGPMGFTQRQAAGKFTRGEVEAFIEQLEEAENTGAAPPAAPPAATVSAKAAPAKDSPRSAGSKAAPAAAGARAAASVATGSGTGSSTEQALRKVPSTMLAAELQRRGWVVLEP